MTINLNIVNTHLVVSFIIYQNLGCTPNSKEIKIVNFITLTGNKDKVKHVTG